MKRVFSTREVEIGHSELVALRKAGKLNLGIDNDLAVRMVAAGHGPRNDPTAAAMEFYSSVALGVLGVSIYLSFTNAWWWFIPGLVASLMIFSANKRGTSQNLLDAAMEDVEFYERFRSAGIWMYEMTEEDAEEYSTSTLKGGLKS